MGQFYSREFDGDPYIDLMRSLPERELVWWTQKVIWLAEGFTFVDHFARTYPRLFQHKCHRCNGTGVLTCPACAGTKIPLSLAAPRLPDQHALPRQLPLVGPAPGASGAGSSRPVAPPNGELASLLTSPFKPSEGSIAASGDVLFSAGVGGQGGECRACGQVCNWDDESEWQERWNDWESKLAYYDKATGPLMDEWYEDIINAGNLEEDTPPVEDEPPGPEVTGQWADDERSLAKDKKRMAALMRRFGHPYDADAMLGYAVVDPTASVGENVWNMAQVYNYLPPELNPMRVQHLQGQGPPGEDATDYNAAALAVFDREIAMESAIRHNLSAAIMDEPKPFRFVPTAGTIPCSECGGSAWGYSLFPNVQRLFGIERPLWTDTLARLEKYWNPTTRRQDLPYGEHGLRSLLLDGEANPLEEITGRAPESTGRYRRELELLVEHPELRDARLRLPPGSGVLEALVAKEEAREAAAAQRDLAEAAVPLELVGISAGPSKARGSGKDQQQPVREVLSRA